MPVVVLGPRVEVPIDEGDLTVRIEDAGGGAVAQPHAIGRYDMEPHARAVDRMRVERVVRSLRCGVSGAEDLDLLVPRERAHDLGIDPGDRPDLSGPVRF